jgi:hypothetical protein
MFSTRTRTIIATFIAAGSLASATVAPAVSQAKEIAPGANTGSWCGALQIEYKNRIADLNEAHESGNQRAINDAREEVNNTLEIAVQEGCKWSDGIAVVKAPSHVVVPIGVARAESATIKRA